MALNVEPSDTGSDAFSGDELLSLALARPRDAESSASALLANKPTPLVASYAWQALSVAHRQLGDGPASLRCARRGLRVAEKTSDQTRVADVLATLGSTLALVGRTRESMEALDRALSASHGVHAARIHVRQAGVLQILGRFDESLTHLRAAVPALRAAGDGVYEARAYNWRALVHQGMGDWARADRDLARAEGLFADLGQDLESAMARHNRGHIAFEAGDLPAALRHCDAAERLYAALDESNAELELDRCRILLAAGMPKDARVHAERAATLLETNTAGAHLRAEALLEAASAGLAVGELRPATRDSERAVGLFRRLERDRYLQRARRLNVLAHWMSGERSVSMLRSAADVAERLESIADPEAGEARLLAGRIAMALGRAEAHAHLTIAANRRGRGPAIARSSGWLAVALLADAAGDRRALLNACRRGLDLLDEHRLTLGATEMRARASVHGAELAAMATRLAVRADDAAGLLLWSERWRATALTAAAVRPPDDDELARELASLRDVTGRLAEARSDGRPISALEREQARLESSVRQRTMRTSGAGGAALPTQRLDVVGLRRALGDTTLVELVEVDGTLHALTVTSRRTTMHTVGPIDAALSELEFALFALRRIAAASNPALVRASVRSLGAAATSLEKALLGPVVDRLGDGPVLVVPSGRLHAVPWSLLARLRDREITVAPSATSWLRAKAMHPPRGHKVTLVVGPGLETGGAEVAKVAGFYPDAQLLDGTAATADDVLDALNGASLAHIAAHGTFRADNALFSSLRLADGPLTVHDLERLRRPPHRLLLSSCDSGLGEVAGADELLGLSSALIGMGSAGLLASVVQVNDPATVPLMVAVHEQLQHGATLAQALHRARMSLGSDDPVLTATGQSFIALGAA